MEQFDFVDWGMVEYGEAHKRQQEVFNKNVSSKLKGEPVNSVLYFCEHEPVITLGKSADNSHMLFNKDWLERHGVSVFKTERGGDVTYHGPGQLVAYPHFDIEKMGYGVKAYIHNIEEAIIRALDEFGIKSERSEGFTGVWIDTGKPNERKICAIGVKCSRGVTMHGLALNVNTDLKYFKLIVPCGIENKGVTSISQELNKEVPMKEVEEVLLQKFREVF